MSDWKVLLTDGLAENGQAVLREVAEVVDRNGITAEELIEEVGNYDAVIVRGRTKFRKNIFEAAAKAKVIGRAGVGVDNIDLDVAKERGVVVVNSPMATSVAVAELAMAMMLSLIRGVPKGDAGMKREEWLKKELKGTELYQKTLGVMGFGRIGAATAARAAAFDMKIVAYDPFLSDDQIRERGGDPVSMDELFAQTDVITMHMPLTDGTRSLLNAAAFAKMKKGVLIICAARGGVIDEADLLEALNSGQVAGAALDVFTKEPPEDYTLASHPNVVATPHIGAQTKEGGQRAAYDIATEVVAALKGEDLRWRVA
jgi:D-3-phosphoglycerate dehydrogenase / 2-oxoglutarate reductase